MKKSHLFAVALLAVVRLTFADEAADAIQKDLDAIEGTWKVESFEYDGQKSTDQNLDTFTVILGADGIAKGQRGGQTFTEAIQRIDPSKKPKTIDITYTAGEQKGQTFLGIYEIDGDVLRICNK